MRQRRRSRIVLNHSVAHARASFLRVAGIVAQTTGVSVADIIHRQRNGRPCRRRHNVKTYARLFTVYLTVTGLNIRQGTLARAIERHRTRIFFDLRAVEDARDNPTVDQLLDRMEAML